MKLIHQILHPILTLIPNISSYFFLVKIMAKAKNKKNNIIYTIKKIGGLACHTFLVMTIIIKHAKKVMKLIPNLF